ncbi:MAG: exonuclease domain-containing protein [Lachnospiraceae bacterium]|nr:exonuclease domain-containing protein [Lachnospiraceae bacterium]
MNYVVVDFEWNQRMFGKTPADNRIPFEIIEIGAVLLDEDLNEIDRFSQTCKPKIYKKLHYKTKEITGISQKELSGSDTFPYVVVDFLLWCGDDPVFCTWGNGDLVELQRNLKYYHLDDLLEGPITYYNVQKMFRLQFDPEHKAESLEAATDFFRLPKKEPFHRAVNDAAYTAEILRQLDPKLCERQYSVDYYQNPKTKEEEIHLVYDDYYKYISREFSSREELMADREVRSVRCFKCGRTARKKLNWFVGKGKSCYCLCECREHGNIRGKIRIKTTDAGNRMFAIKTIRLIDEEGADKIREMKQEVIEKRWERRHRGSAAREQ